MPVITGGEIYSGAQRGNLFSISGAPVANTTLVGQAAIGDLLVNRANGTVYVCTATNGSTTITWTVVGSQT